MSINEILEQQGWELVQRQRWIAVQDHRAEFRKAFTTNRVGKIIGASFYVTLSELPAYADALIREAGDEPRTLKSTSGARNIEYVGFDTSTVPADRLRIFVTKLADGINELIDA